MGSLKFRHLKILSDKDKKAIQFKFNDRFNLILAKGKNSVGKSTVVKTIFWCLGCEPRLDDEWKELDCKAVLQFEVNGVPHWVARNGDRLFYSDNGTDFDFFSKVSGNFSKLISTVVNFNALLPNRKDEAIVTPPPAFYFLPFYIDQKHSWANAWDSFDRLGQFANWQKDIISYHVGITKKRYFDLTEDIYNKKQQQKKVKGEIERVDTAITVVKEFIPDIDTTLDVEELDQIKNELKEDILALHKEQELLFEELASLRAEKAYAQSQFEIANNAIAELLNDYEFSTDLDDELLCPICGTTHDNSLVNRFSLLEDKDQAEQVLARIRGDLRKIDSSFKDKENELEQIRKKIQILNEKYYRELKNTKITLQNILDGAAAHSVKHKVEGYRQQKSEQLYDFEKEEKSLENDRKESIKINRDIVKSKFQELYPAYISKLGALGVNSSAIKSPDNYRKVAQSGGAAEGSRAMLAYYLTIYNLINLYSEEILSPLVIDTPNQHEQAAKHYKSIVGLVRDHTPTHSQIFLCGMDSPNLQPLKEEASVFFLETEHALLNSVHYQDIKENIGWIFESI